MHSYASLCMCEETLETRLCDVLCFSDHDSNELPAQEMQVTDTARYRYQAENFNIGGTNNDFEEKINFEQDDVPMDSYEEMEVNAPVLPPKPQPKAPPKKPNVNTLDSTRYVRSSGQQNVRKTATMPQMRSQIHGRVQQQPPVRAESPETIYEVPD